MPRIAGLDTPGLLHHVMIRGIERRKIFNDDTDRENLIERLSILLPKTNTQCYAWSFLSNHAHFLFRSGPAGIAALMRRLLTGYQVLPDIDYYCLKVAFRTGSRQLEMKTAPLTGVSGYNCTILAKRSVF